MLKMDVRLLTIGRWEAPAVIDNDDDDNDHDDDDDEQGQ